jgi:hypothetical protein
MRTWNRSWNGNFCRACVLALLLGGAAATVGATDLAVSGNLTVSGLGVIQGSSLQLGTAAGTPTAPGLIFTYVDTDSTHDQIGFSADRLLTTWIWQYGSAGTWEPQMMLDATNTLTIYNRASTPAAGITLNPAGTSTFTQSLTANGTNNLLPNQTLTGAGSILTEGLADARYLTSSTFMIAPFVDSYGAGSDYSIAGASASGVNTMAIGPLAVATGDTTIAIGYAADAVGGSAISIGEHSHALAATSVGIGSWSFAKGVASYALGYEASSDGYGSIAFSQFAYSPGYWSGAGGPATTAQGYGQFVVGQNNIPQGTGTSWVATDDLFIVGNGPATITSALTRGASSNAFAVKKNGETSVFGSKLNFGLVSGVAPGAAGSTGARLIYADGSAGAVTFSASKAASTWAWQNNDTATAKPQMSLSGSNVLTLYNSSGVAAIVLDPANPPVTNGITQTIADGRYASSTAFTSGTGLDQFGATVATFAIGGTVEGGGALAVGVNSYAGESATAVGEGASASTTNAVALGGGATANGASASAIGYDAWAQGDDATASGVFSYAYGTYSTASATDAETFGYAATASGSDSYAYGDYSTASAFAATAQGQYSVAAGPNTTATGFGQFVVGQYNVQQGDPASWNPTDDLFQVGNGTSPMNQSNAFAVKKNGDTTVAGQLTVAGRIRVNPQGNLAMGEFTADPTP